MERIKSLIPSRPPQPQGDDLGEVDEIDWSAAVIGSCSTAAIFGGAKTVPNHDSEMAIPLIDAVEAIKRPRCYQLGVVHRAPNPVRSQRPLLLLEPV